jgi:hypothetical protein
MSTTIPVLCGTGGERCRRVLKSIVAVGVCIFALMVVIKDGRVLRTAGLTGSCSVVQIFSDSSELAACRPGKLQGRPNLAQSGCRAVGSRAKLWYWSCPAGFKLSAATSR